MKGVEGGPATSPVSPEYRWRRVSGVECLTWDQTRPRAKKGGDYQQEIGHGGAGGITVFGKKTEGTVAVEG
jgi:hypothetical protein